jgi:hypothetical protein
MVHPREACPDSCSEHGAVGSSNRRWADTGAAKRTQDSPNKIGGMPQAQGNLTTIAQTLGQDARRTTSRSTMAHWHANAITLDCIPSGGGDHRAA